MSQQHMPQMVFEGKHIMPERGKAAHHISHHDEHLRLVEGHPVLDILGKCVHRNLHIIQIQVDDLRGFPSAQPIHPHRHVPVIQGDQGLDAIGFQFVNQIPIEGNPFFIHFALLRHDPRPADGETVALQPHLLHQRHVFLPAVIMITGFVAGFAVLQMFRVGYVPDAGGLSVNVPCAFNLRGSTGRAPEKIFWKWHIGFLLHYFFMTFFMKS